MAAEFEQQWGNQKLLPGQSAQSLQREGRHGVPVLLGGVCKTCVAYQQLGEMTRCFLGFAEMDFIAMCMLDGGEEAPPKKKRAGLLKHIKQPGVLGAT